MKPLASTIAAAAGAALFILLVAEHARAATVVIKPGQMCGWTTAMKTGTDGAGQVWLGTDRWKESINFRGLLDKFTVGVRDANGKITKTTWDFDAGLPQKTVFITNRTTRDPIIDAAKHNFRFVVFGEVDSVHAADWSRFTLNDGAGNLVTVWAPGSAFDYYDYIRALGTLDTSADPPVLISSAGDVSVISVGTPASTGPSMIVEPTFYYYLNRTPESIVDELKANGYYDVLLSCINESGINNSLVKAFAGSGVKVWMMTFVGVTYSTADMPAGWESWQMVLRRPSSYIFLCPNNPNYRAWKKSQVVTALQVHPFYGIHFAEPFLPNYGGPTSDHYGCLCSYCADAFRAMYPGVPGPPDFENPSSPDFWQTNTALYQKWMDFRVASVNGFLNELVNGPGGVRASCPKKRRLGAWGWTRRTSSPSSRNTTAWTRRRWSNWSAPTSTASRPIGRIGSSPACPATTSSPTSPWLTRSAPPRLRQ